MKSIKTLNKMGGGIAINLKRICLLSIFTVTSIFSSGQITINQGSYSSWPAGSNAGIIFEIDPNLPGNAIQLNSPGLLNLNTNAIIEVRAGVTLTINIAIIQYYSGGSFRINSSATAVLNGVDLTCGVDWTGIVVESAVDQYDVLPPSPNSGSCVSNWRGIRAANQTTLQLNNSKITNAFVGIDCSNHVLGSCGIVNALESVFTNCATAILMEKSTSNLSGENLSYNTIMGCIFEWNFGFPIPHPGVNVYYGVKLKNCHSIKIGGCWFKDLWFGNSSNSFANSYAIYADESTIEVGTDGKDCYFPPLGTDKDPCPQLGSSAGPGKGCTFANFDVAIYYKNPRSESTVMVNGNPVVKEKGRLGVRNNSFTNNKIGVFVDKTYNFGCSWNTFNFDQNENVNIFGSNKTFSAIDVGTNGYNGVAINNNKINYTNATSSATFYDFIRIHKKINDGESYIRQNDFNCDAPLTTCGRTEKAISILGNCSPLNITCNKFYNTATDIWIDPTSGILPFIGIITNPLSNGNLFSSLIAAFSCPYANINKNILYGYDVNLGTATDVPNQNPSSNYSYTSVQRDNNDCGPAKCDDYLKTSVKNLNSAAAIMSVYPNPNDGNFTLQIPTVKHFITIRCYDVAGKLIFNIEEKNPTNEVSISAERFGSRKGLFMMMVSDEKGNTETVKVSIQ